LQRSRSGTEVVRARLAAALADYRRLGRERFLDAQLGRVTFGLASDLELPAPIAAQIAA
jgi:hypothetical protein